MALALAQGRADAALNSTATVAAMMSANPGTYERPDALPDSGACGLDPSHPARQRRILAPAREVPEYVRTHQRLAPPFVLLSGAREGMSDVVGDISCGRQEIGFVYDRNPRRVDGMHARDMLGFERRKGMIDAENRA